jgi:hypothetical protein
MLHPDFRIARAGPRDLARVLELLAEHLPGADVAQRHDWLYERNPHGRAVTMIAYDPAGAPAGITSVFPRRVLVDGRARVGSIGGDGFVRPAYRRRGLAGALHRGCLEAMRGDGVDFMYGPPEPNNLKALMHAGSRVVARVRRYARPRLLSRALSTLSRLRRNRLRLVPLSGVDGRVASVFERVAAFARVAPVRDPVQYAWRFGESPSGVQRAYAIEESGRAVGLCAIEREGDAIALLDMLAPVDRWAQAVDAIADATGAAHLSIQLNDQGPAASALWRAGFVPREAKAFQVLAAADDPDQAALFGAAGWYYTWADGDVDRVL